MSVLAQGRPIAVHDVTVGQTGRKTEPCTIIPGWETGVCRPAWTAGSPGRRATRAVLCPPGRVGSAGRTLSTARALRYLRTLATRASGGSVDTGARAT